MATPLTRAWRRIALLSADHRYDLAIPLDDSLQDVVRRLGLSVVPGRHTIVDRAGRETPLSARGEDLDDGALLTLVDLTAPAPTPADRRRAVRASVRERGTVWWMLGVAGVLLAGLVIADAGSGTLLPDIPIRILAGVLLAGGAAASALLWVAHKPDDTPRAGLAMLAPLVLAFDGGAIIVPPLLVGAGHLAATAGLLAAGIVAALLSVVLVRPQLRAAARMATTVLLVLAAVWGVTLFAGAGPAAAAAVSAGLVPLGLRFLPSTLLDVAEGHHIDYEHFMSSRWTVRGIIPEDPGPVEMPAVRSAVAESSARLLVGVALLAAVPPLVVPLVLPGLASPDPFVFGGTVGLLTTVAVALLLGPRHAGHPVLRWAPRAAAAIVLVEVAAALAVAGTPVALTLAAAALLVCGVAAGALLIPIGRGAASLAWSRLADAVEWLAVALSLPAGLLAADALDLLRGMMAA